MSESGSSEPECSDEEIDDPGRDPKGLRPAAQPVRRRPDQDTGQGEPRGDGNVGPGDKPEAADRRAGDADADEPTTGPDGGLSRASHSAVSSPAGDDHGRAGSTVVPSVDPHRQPAAGDVDRRPCPSRPGRPPERGVGRGAGAGAAGPGLPHPALEHPQPDVRRPASRTLTSSTFTPSGNSAASNSRLPGEVEGVEVDVGEAGQVRVAHRDGEAGEHLAGDRRLALAERRGPGPCPPSSRRRGWPRRAAGPRGCRPGRRPRTPPGRAAPR